MRFHCHPLVHLIECLQLPRPSLQWFARSFGYGKTIKQVSHSSEQMRLKLVGLFEVSEAAA
jgi:hypothetical protein